MAAQGNPITGNPPGTDDGGPAPDGGVDTKPPTVTPPRPAYVGDVGSPGGGGGRLDVNGRAY